MTNEELFLAGDLDSLYRKNERFMHHICRKYLNLGVPYDDLLGCADLAFMKAIRWFNPAHSKWLTYFSRVIGNEILIFNRRQKNWKQNVSLQQVIREDGNGHILTFEELLFYEEQLCDKEQLEEVQRAMGKLSVLQQEVLKLTLQGYTQKGIGAKLGHSQSYISRVLRDSRKQLKKEMGA